MTAPVPAGATAEHILAPAVTLVHVPAAAFLATAIPTLVEGICEK